MTVPQTARRLFLALVLVCMTPLAAGCAADGGAGTTSPLMNASPSDQQQAARSAIAVALATRSADPPNVEGLVFACLTRLGVPYTRSGNAYVLDNSAATPIVEACTTAATDS